MLNNRYRLQLINLLLAYVESFIYLGSIIDEHCGSDADVKARIVKPTAADLQLKNIWNAKSMSTNNKARTSSTNVKTVLFHHPQDTSVCSWLSTRNTSDPLARRYQQQPTMREDIPDSSGGRYQEEVLRVDRAHTEESTQLRHKTSPHLESSRPKEKRKIEEDITPRNGDRHEENEQKLDRSRKEGGGQSGLKISDRQPMLHLE
ncbi:unnamed protein product [Schistosoma curassoni]|uniref:DUF6451 domain-containing protein n=1 Tax=Schistosoma curassoni TaxID=6186 RepID=A0A183KLA5_9TREM|nr:unnamed protein product [Schistosoma curassoni]